MPANEEIKAKYLRLYSETSDRPGFLIRRLHQIHVAIFLEECSGKGITPVQFSVLSSLTEHSALDQGTLGAQVGIDRTNIADVVARLEGKGFVNRIVNPKDRRMKLVSINIKGIKFLELTMESMMRAQEKFVDPLTKSEYETLMKLLKKIFHKNNKTGRAIFDTTTRPQSP